MIKVHTCPICSNKYRVIVDPKTNEKIPHTRCPYNGCKSYTILEPSTSETYINNIMYKYRELVGKSFALGVDGTQRANEVVIDVQGDGSVIMIDRIEYLPVRLTAKQFEVYLQAAENYENA